MPISWDKDESATAATTGESTHYTNLYHSTIQDSDNKNDEEFRLNVFREIFCMRWWTHSPRFEEARPDHFPPEINVFLTGGLFMFVNDAMFSWGRTHGGGFVLFFLMFLLLVLAVAWWDDSASHNSRYVNDDQGGGHYEEYDSAHIISSATYWLGVVCVFFLSQMLTGSLRRTAVRQLHEQMHAVVQHLAPVFQLVGYNLEYKISTTFYNTCSESYICIVPYSGTLSAEERAHAESIINPPTLKTRDPGSTFRVAVYGESSSPGNSCYGQEHNFLIHSSYEDVQNRYKIDKFTWGAVSTELRSLTVKYKAIRLYFLLIALIPLHIVLNIPDSWWQNEWWHSIVNWGTLAVFMFVCFGSSLIETWWMKYVLRKNVLEQMRAKVQQLSPLVEERSGYSLHFDTEKEGCLGASTAGYVYFSAATSSTNVHRDVTLV